MRKPIAVLAILILALFAAAGRAAADSTSYDISGKFGGGTSTALSNPGDLFTISIHDVDPATLGGSPLATPPDAIKVDYSDTSASITASFMGTITFEASGATGGLLDIDFNFGGDSFLLFLSSSDPTVQLYTDTGGVISLPSTPPGGFAIESDPGDCSASFLGDDVTGNCTRIESGTVHATATTVPEPSSLLLLACSLLVMTAFARRRFA